MSATIDARVGAVFTALADDTRRALLASIASHGGATATELAAGTTITRQAVAKHLAVLSAAGLVAPLRSGRETRYRVVPGSLRPPRRHPSRRPRRPRRLGGVLEPP